MQRGEHADLAIGGGPVRTQVPWAQAVLGERDRDLGDDERVGVVPAGAARADQAGVLELAAAPRPAQARSRRSSAGAESQPAVLGAGAVEPRLSGPSVGHRPDSAVPSRVAGSGSPRSIAASWSRITRSGR